VDRPAGLGVLQALVREADPARDNAVLEPQTYVRLE